MYILAINPGSTSTKIALFEDEKVCFSETIRHTTDQLLVFDTVSEQYHFRREVILKCMIQWGIYPDQISAVVGRGGLLKPISGGVYRVNEMMIHDLKKGVMGEHASNLGGILAREIAVAGGHENAFIVNPVVVDEMADIARFSGDPELPRLSIFHALNQKAVGRRYARKHNTTYEELNLIIAHMGGGISVGVHQKGRVIDVNNALDGAGPFSPERTGTLPAGGLAKLCYSGKYTFNEIKKKIKGSGGLVAYFGTGDAVAIEKQSETDPKALLIYRAMGYQVAKEIAACGAVLSGDVDAILLTGGLAYSDLLINEIRERVLFVAPVTVYPGEDELEALAHGAFRGMISSDSVKDYH